MARPVAKSRSTSRSMSRSSLALSNLRAVVILIVLAFHSVLAYVKFIPRTSGGFTDPPFEWRSFPIVDSQRWFGFDLFCAWQDVYLMSLMFLLSGLFVWPSLARKGNLPFARDRFLRLGVPYIFGIIILIPIAIYPVYLLSAADPSVPDYLHEYWSLPFIHNGQLWFLWQLLALNFVAVGVNFVAPNALKNLGRWLARAGKRPGFCFAVLVAAAAAAYVPLALAFTPWEWTDTGLFAVQWSRPLLYAVFFFTGLGIGVEGLDNGLVAADGALAQQWLRWLLAAVGSLILWMGMTYFTLGDTAPVIVQTAAALSFVLACASGCFFLIAVCLRFATKRSPVLSALSDNAYGLYLLHYDFMVWLQYAFLASAMFAVVKGALVFGGSLLFSWIGTLAMQRSAIGARLIGAAPPQDVESHLVLKPRPFPAALYARLREFVSE